MILKAEFGISGSPTAFPTKLESRTGRRIRNES
jgi:hypothetical protein